MSLIIRICSINAHDCFDEKYDFNDWICPDDQPDIVVVGVQELTHKVKDIALGSTNLNSIAKRWLLKVTLSANIKEKYETLKWSRIGSLLLIVYVKKTLGEKISGVMLGSLAIGTLGMANKGCVAILFKVDSTQFCFINAHLVAGRTNNLKRLDDFQNIMDFLKFSSDDDKDFKTVSTISEINSDVLFLFGDLNFRLQNISKSMTKKVLENGITPSELLNYDEFYLNREKEPYYSFFEEGEIKFMPSYKFMKGADVYNLQEKGHLSYTDRILWRGKLDIKNLSYEMHKYISFSDHKPISGMYEVTLLKTKLSDQENSPASSTFLVSTKCLDFGTVRFLESKKVSMSAKNQSDGLIKIRISQNSSEIKLPKWLTVFPNNFLMEPKQSIKINFTANIQKEEVFYFNLGHQKITDVQIYLFSDTDLCIPLKINGDYGPTLLGLPLEILQVLKCPVSRVSCQDLNKMYENVKNGTSREIFDQPSFGLALVYRLLTILKQKTSKVAMNDIKKIQENVTDKINIREFLDSGYMKPFIRVDYPTVFNMVLLFLELLPTPLIPVKFKIRCLAANNDPDTIVKIINSMPSLYNKVFRRVLIHITQFDSELTQSTNIMEEIDYLSACLEKAIFRSNTTNQHQLGCEFFKFILSSKVMKKTNRKGNIFLNTLYRHSRVVTNPTPVIENASTKSEGKSSKYTKKYLDETDAEFSYREDY